MTIIRINNPFVFNHEVVQAFFLEAIKECHYTNPEGVLRDIVPLMGNPDVGCWVACGPDGPVSVITVMLPQNALMECPQILLAFSKDPEGMTAVVEAALAFCREKGYSRAWGINRSGHEDPALQRLFGYVGFIRPVGNVLEYEF